MVLWAWFGLGVVIYVAGLANIPQEQYDAAKVDGSGLFSGFQNVTVPWILLTMSYWAVLCTSGLFLWLFPFIFTLTNGGGPGYSSITPEVWVYQVATAGQNPYYASALGLILFVLVLVVAIPQIRFMYQRTTV